ncbi:MAG: hypothetical protein ACWGNK_09390 [Desulfobacterales bacterium]|jgi:hypothetical protein
MKGKETYVKVTDGAGNEFICPIDALKDRASASEEELENCVDDGVVGRYASNIDIEK